jgi:hypothetical protein
LVPLLRCLLDRARVGLYVVHLRDPVGWAFAQEVFERSGRRGKSPTSQRIHADALSIRRPMLAAAALLAVLTDAAAAVLGAELAERVGALSGATPVVLLLHEEHTVTTLETLHDGARTGRSTAAGQKRVRCRDDHGHLHPRPPSDPATDHRARASPSERRTQPSSRKAR